MRKTFILVLILFGVFIVFTQCQTTTRLSRKADTPWQILMNTLYTHGVDTVGLHVKSRIDPKTLREAKSDLEKAYKVKSTIDIANLSYLGEVVTAYMNAKYRNQGGEKYDYLKTCYSALMCDFESYYHRYPDSPYNEELTAKYACLDQNYSWTTSMSDENCHQLHGLYGIRPCPYDGFSNLMKENEAFHQAVDDWDDMWEEIDKKQEEKCEKLHAFQNTHESLPLFFRLTLKKMIKECPNETKTPE